jgi:hypothetical protein
MKKGKRFLNFAATNLATHKLSYIKMLDGNIGIQVGNESEFQQGDKNTGKLTIDNLQMINTNILTGGYQTGAELLLSNGSFESGQILGEYPRSEKISLNNMQLINATLFSDSYTGIRFDGQCKKYDMENRMLEQISKQYMEGGSLFQQITTTI